MKPIDQDKGSDLYSGVDFVSSMAMSSEDNSDNQSSFSIRGFCANSISNMIEDEHFLNSTIFQVRNHTNTIEPRTPSRWG